MYNNIFVAVSNVTTSSEKLTDVINYGLDDKLTFYYDNDKCVVVDPHTDNIIIYNHKGTNGLKRNICGENYNELAEEERIKCLSEEERILLLNHAKYVYRINVSTGDSKHCNIL